jgi:hypothetical protein
MNRTNGQNNCEWNPISGGIAEGKLRHYLNASRHDEKIATTMFQPEIIDGRSLEKVTQSANRLGKNPSGGSIVSDLNLGFWAGLFQKGGPASFNPSLRIKHPETLWDPALSKLFKGDTPERKVIAALTLKILYLRNRIAHHEPILFGIAQPGSKKEDKQIKQEPINAYADLIQLAGFLDVALGDFLLENFSVLDLLESDLSQQALRYAKSHQNLYWI